MTSRPSQPVWDSGWGAFPTIVPSVYPGSFPSSSPPFVAFEEPLGTRRSS